MFNPEQDMCRNVPAWLSQLPKHLPQSLFLRRARSRESTFGQMSGMVADILRPWRDQIGKPVSLPCIERSSRLFVARLIASKSLHEAIGSLLSLSLAIVGITGSPRRFDESPQCDGRTSRLSVEPFPMPRQQRHFASDDTELRTPRPPFCRLSRTFVTHRQTGEALLYIPTQIEIDEPSGSVVKDQNPACLLGFQCCDDFRRRAAGDAFIALKGGPTELHPLLLISEMIYPGKTAGSIGLDCPLPQTRDAILEPPGDLDDDPPSGRFQPPGDQP